MKVAGVKHRDLASDLACSGVTWLFCWDTFKEYWVNIDTRQEE
jgi:hypothetical protein